MQDDSTAYIKIRKDFFNSPTWLTKRTFSIAEAMLDLHALTNEDEAVVSTRFLSDRWNWSVGRVFKFLKKLEQDSLKKQLKNGRNVLKYSIESDVKPRSPTTDLFADAQVGVAEETEKPPEIQTEIPTISIYPNNYNPLFEIVKIFKPRAKLPRPNKEVVAWQRMKTKPTKDDIDLMKKFYKIPKSLDCDDTWRRKQDTVTLLHNWQDMLESAIQFTTTPKNTPKTTKPTFHNFTPEQSDSPDFWD